MDATRSSGTAAELESALKALEEAAECLQSQPLEELEGMERCCAAVEERLKQVRRLVEEDGVIAAEGAERVRRVLASCDEKAKHAILRVTLERERLRHALKVLDLDRRYLQSLTMATPAGQRVDEQG